MSDANPVVIFDCDGTLLDSAAGIVRAMLRAFEALGHPAPPDGAVRGIIGLSVREAVATLAPTLDAPALDRMVAAYRDAYLAGLAEAEGEDALYPGTLDALDALEAAGHVLAVATGKSRRGLDRVIAAHGLEGRFVSLQTADHHPSKPHPAMARQAMLEAGGAPHSTVLVGDTGYDMAMARGAGCFALGVGWGYHDRGRLMAAGAQALATDRPEIVTHVTQLLCRGKETSQA
ncbi:HAD-IA family hydrolase [Yunchengibacter salinarum]|uniref:HAD-IA family hydrolase n=1 Tax=Yunchengibacter salinarum TaxID=3133399 RepID=UPI0035B61340